MQDKIATAQTFVDMILDDLEVLNSSGRKAASTSS